MKKLILPILILIFFFSIYLSNYNSNTKIPRLWKIQSIDTMKFSRDLARQEDTNAKIPLWVSEISNLNPTHIAIATPYDDEFLPILKTWVKEARKHNLHIWFRGNFSGWEGWFDYPKFVDANQHHKAISNFIQNNPDLFEEGDIFTPAPEPENGILGDPRASQVDAQNFRNFLITSYINCNYAFSKIHKKIACGYFSTNADIAKEIFDPSFINKIGGITTIDHYTNTSEKFGSDINLIHQKNNSDIFLGEFGAPIPDINGDMSEVEQEKFVDSLLTELYRHKNYVTGVNYWLFSGGETALFNDDGTPRKVAEIIRNYYNPSLISGKIVNPLGDSLGGIEITVNHGFVTTQTNGLGKYELVIPGGKVDIEIYHKEFKTKNIQTEVKNGEKNTLNVILEPQNPGLIYKIRKNYISFYNNPIKFIWTNLQFYFGK